MKSSDTPVPVKELTYLRECYDKYKDINGQLQQPHMSYLFGILGSIGDNTETYPDQLFAFCSMS